MNNFWKNDLQLTTQAPSIAQTPLKAPIIHLPQIKDTVSLRFRGKKEPLTKGVLTLKPGKARGGIWREAYWGTLEINGNPIELAPLEYATTLSLMEHVDNTVSRSSLINGIKRHYGEDFTGATLHNHVLRVRKKIETDYKNPRYLITLGKGGGPGEYMLVSDPDAREGQLKREEVAQKTKIDSEHLIKGIFTLTPDPSSKKGTLQFEDKSISLNKTEYVIMKHLMNHADQAISKEELTTHTQEHSYPFKGGNIYKQILKLRKKIEADYKKPRYLIGLLNQQSFMLVSNPNAVEEERARNQNVLSEGNITLYTAQRSVRVGTRDSISLAPREYNLLLHFMNNLNQTIRRDTLIKAIWNENAPSDTSDALDKLISRLRKLIEPNSKKTIYIRTVWGTGYKFTPSGQDT